MKSWFMNIFFGRTQRAFWRQTIVVACLAAPFVIVWRHYKDEIALMPEYAVTQRNIYVLDPPTWYSRVIPHEVLDLLPPEYHNKPLASFDANFVEALKEAFKAHPMILDVESIVCQYPALVKARLVFRNPVAVVDASAQNAANALEEIRNRFPEEYAQAYEAFQRDNPGAYDALAETNAFARKLNSGDYYLVDAQGEKLPTQYFLDHPDSYQTLPQILGVTKESETTAGKTAQGALRDAAALVDFLQQNNAIQRYNITKIYAFRKSKEYRARFILKAPTEGRNAAFISWGTCDATERGKTLDTTQSGADANAQDVFDARQSAKLQTLDALFKATLRQIDICENATDMVERAKLPSLYNPDFNIPRMLATLEREGSQQSSDEERNN